MIYLLAGPAALETRGEWLPVLERAIAESDGRWSVDSLLADVADGSLIVWVLRREDRTLGVWTTRVCQSAIRYVSIEDCAGERLSEWIHEALHTVEQWAREMGAQQIIFSGRRGWEKVLRSHGFETSRIEGVKQLESLH